MFHSHSYHQGALSRIQVGVNIRGIIIVIMLMLCLL